MKKIVIVDYGLGNIFSIKQALLVAGTESVITNKVSDLKTADGIILPGMGAFAEAMDRINELGLAEALCNMVINEKMPILGICLGLQLFFERSFEFGEHNGLGIIPGVVRRFPDTYNNINLRIPFIGWNNVLCDLNSSNLLLQELDAPLKMFFVHSFYVEPENRDCVLGISCYQGFEYPAIVQYKNISGFQGHPEKSGHQGVQIYKNWLKSI